MAANAAELHTPRLRLRPITAQDGHLVHALLTDNQVRAYLGCPASDERVVARQASYPATAGVWAVIRLTDDHAVGLVNIGPDHRCEGRAEISYQFLPTAWGHGLGREAVDAVIRCWSAAGLVTRP
ncbi:GNAT family N-acetyltransferase [Streptomyces sp. NPDC005227]|uniref:GNAT family N-acetyltransferase n=1 Tax=Streptomyces sp. NPDC005227 TaxID=3364707 RepID=UPI0036BF5DB1